jgi:hypothetical protein
VRQLASETTQQMSHIVGSAIQTAQQVNQFVHFTLETAQTAHTALRQAAIDQLFAGFSRQDLPQNVPQNMPQALPQNLSHGLSLGRQGPSSTQQDAEVVKEQATKLVQEKVCDPFRNLISPKVTRAYVSSATENEIHVDFMVTYEATRFSMTGAYRDKVNGMITLSFKPTWEGGVKVYKIHSASHNGIDQGIHTRPEEVGKKLDTLRANERIVTTTRFDQNANRFDFGKDQDRIRTAVENYVKQHLGAQYEPKNTFGLRVDRIQDGFRVNVSFRTRSEQSPDDTNPAIKVHAWVNITMDMKLVGMAEGQAQYVATITKEKLEWTQFDSVKGGRSVKWDGSLNDVGLGNLAKDFSTTKQINQLISPAHVAKEVFNNSQKILSGMGFKDFKLQGYEFLDSGVRVKFEALAANGQKQTFLVDVAYDGLRGYHCVRATHDFDTVTPGQTNRSPSLEALVKDVRGSWVWTPESKDVVERVVRDFKAIFNNFGFNRIEVKDLSFTEIDGGVRVSLNFVALRHDTGLKTFEPLTLDIKVNGEQGYHAVGANLSWLQQQPVPPDLLDVAAFKQALLRDIGKIS